MPPAAKSLATLRPHVLVVDDDDTLLDLLRDILEDERFSVTTHGAVDGAHELARTVGATVANHVNHILCKLGFPNRAAVAAWAVAQGLDTVGDLVATR